MIEQTEIKLPKFSRGFHDITDILKRKISSFPDIGLLHIFVKHTSAAITINENADPSVIYDLNSFLNSLAPDDNSLYTHIYEGSDDMPAHIKSSITGCEITVPVSNGDLNLGIWQGIYLCEFRNSAKSRTLVLTIYS